MDPTYAALTLTTLLWSCNSIIGRALRDEVTRLTINFQRWAIALMVLGRAHRRSGGRIGAPFVSSCLGRAHRVARPLSFVPPTTPPARGASPALQRRAIRAVAFIEALKGAVVLVGATGLLSLVHKDLDHIAARLIAHTHLNPASRFPHIFLDAAAHVQQTHLLWLAAGAAAYAVVRLIEAYGLFWERAWAEWLAALSGGLYVPIEVVHLVRRPSWFVLGVLAANVAVVVIMTLAIVRRRRAPGAQAA